MKLNFMGIIEILFPSTPDEIILRSCTTDSFATKAKPFLKNKIWSLSSYSEPEIRAAIHLHKFHHNTKAQSLLVALCIRGCANFQKKTYTVLPIPLSPKRKKERGYNQVTEILKEVVKKTPQLTLNTRTLIKNKHTAPQTSLSKKGRLLNVQNVFAVVEYSSMPPKDSHILLVDDVTTTGTTLREAKKTLTDFGYHSVTCVAFAH